MAVRRVEGQDLCQVSAAACHQDGQRPIGLGCADHRRLEGGDADATAGKWVALVQDDREDLELW